MTNDTAPCKPTADDHDGQFMAHRHFEDEWTLNESYATRQEAIDAYGPDHGQPDGAFFKTAKLHLVKQAPDCPYDADNFVDQAADALASEWPEGTVEQFIDSWTDELRAEFTKKVETLWAAFCEKHNLTVTGYFTQEMESHVVGQDESDGELAIRAAAKQLEALDAQILEAMTAAADADVKDIIHAPEPTRLRAEMQALKAQHPEAYRRAFGLNPRAAANHNGISLAEAEARYRAMFENDRADEGVL